MKNIIIFVSVLILCGCASSTVIKTIPDGVRVKQGNELIGITPYEHWDREVSNYVLNLTLSKEGYRDKEIAIEKNVLYIHRLIVPPIIGLPWLLGYNPSYLYELEKEETPTANIKK